VSLAVWDASALLSLLLREPGADKLASRLPEAAMSAVNLAEVAAKLLEVGGAPEMTRQVLQGLPIEIHELTEDQAYRTAELRASTKSLGLSLGDRACLALASSLDLPALTADRAWLELGSGLGVAVELARLPDR
jgi:PIN domain nuclease of toxin-antitoxin system